MKDLWRLEANVNDVVCTDMGTRDQNEMVGQAYQDFGETSKVSV